jgi:AcrR family transcriptional regulator
MAKARQRRTAEEAQEEILSAAEAILIERGPAGLRLQELAEQVGISHPAILHHFGSRDGLMKAVVSRAVNTLQEDLVKAMTGGEEPNPLGVVERVYETLGKRGHARLMAWLVLSGEDPFDSPEIRAKWKQIIDVTHEGRVSLLGDRAPPREDTAFTVALSALALFAQALGGPMTFRASGLSPGPRTEERFRVWLATLLAAHLTSPPA